MKMKDKNHSDYTIGKHESAVTHGDNKICMQMLQLRHYETPNGNSKPSFFLSPADFVKNIYRNQSFNLKTDLMKSIF